MSIRVNIFGVVIVAAGRGTRAGGSLPKQYQSLNGQPVLSRTIHAFARRSDIAQIVVAIHPDDTARAQEASPEDVTLVQGGADRSASVSAGLAVLNPDITHVLIHDAARATVPEAVITDVMTALQASDGAAPALPVTDALWRADQGYVAAPHPRDGLYRAQTPQGFALAAIRAAHAKSTTAAADDVEVALRAGIKVAIVPGHEDNLKLTYPEDFARAARILKD